MKHITFCMLLLAFFIAPGCRKSEIINTDAIPLGDCAATNINGEPVSICYNKLLVDSRCPEDKVCIWKGAAKGNFTFKARGYEANFDLSTITMGSEYRRDTVLFGFKIKLKDIKPYPGGERRRATASVEITE